MNAVAVSQTDVDARGRLRRTVAPGPEAWPDGNTDLYRAFLRWLDPHGVPAARARTTLVAVRHLLAFLSQPVEPVALAAATRTLLAGLWAGLVRVGWKLPPLQPALPLAHGPLMVSGFLGTLISLERAVALGRPAAYAIPLASGLGGLALLLGVPAPAAPLLITLASAGLTGLFASVFRRHPTLFTGVMGLGALAWLVGNALWLRGVPIYGAVSWFGGFLLLTIVGERLELSRLARPARMRREAFLAAVTVYLVALLVAARAPETGMRLEGVAMLALALWLARFDIARYTVRQASLPRFIAVSLLSGYVWLGLAGSLWIIFGGAIAGPFYDAMLHTLFLGFVFAMIFAHAPIILPAVLGGPVPYRADFYGPLALLNLSLIVRLSGDLAGSEDVRRWGGLLGVAAVPAFVVNTARTILETRQTDRGRGTRDRRQEL
jgi:hypothetical protein